MRIKKINLPLNFEDDYWNNNFKDLRNYIYFTLGGGTVKVESNMNQYNLAIYEAIKKYYEFENMGVNTEILNLDTNKEAVLPSHIEPSLVNDVLFKSNTTVFSQMDYTNAVFDAFFLRDVANPIIGGSDILQYVMARQKLKDLDKTLGTDRTWEIINNKIVCFPKGMQETTIGIIYGALLLPEDLESDGWIQNYAVEHFKHMLGRNRDKISGFNTSAGTSTNDGKTLIDEAIAEKQKLIEEIKSRRMPLPILKM